MRFALLNSGLGLLGAASELHRLRPDADLVLSMDPDGMPWGPRSPEEIADRTLAIASAAAAFDPDVLVLACNTATVHALEALRAEFEPDIPVVGTVPAIKPAAASAGSVAIWATVATTGSDYQRKLIAEFGGRATVTPVACPGLASAVDAGDAEAMADAIATAAIQTPAGCAAVVLGCTEYELAAKQIGAAVPGARLFGSAAAVAAQVLRRLAETGSSDGPGAAVASAELPREGVTPPGPLRAEAASHARLAALGAPGDCPGDDLGGDEFGKLIVLLSGRSADLPSAALKYRQGRELARLASGTEAAPGLLV